MNGSLFVLNLVGSVLFGLALLGGSPEAQAQPSFSEVSESEGIGFQDESVPPSSPHRPNALMGQGIAWVDFDNDGKDDLFIPNTRSYADTPEGGPSRLYRNTGTGFDLVALPVLVDFMLRSSSSTGVAVGDYNGDGYDDLFVTNLGQNLLLTNSSDGAGGRTFSINVAHFSNFAEDKPSFVASFGDLNDDGYLDLYVGNWNGLEVGGVGAYGVPCVPNDLYINNGDGLFTKAPAGVGVDNEGCTFGVTLSDYDNDGRLDILVVNDSLADPFTGSVQLSYVPVLGNPDWEVRLNELYHNDGPDPATGMPQFSPAGMSTAFNDVSMPNWVWVTGTTDPLPALFCGMGIAVGDVDNDGDLDYHRTNCTSAGLQTTNQLSPGGQPGFSSLLHGDTSVAGFGWGAAFVDADNDGFLDLIRANERFDEVLNAELYINNNGALSNANSAVASGLVCGRSDCSDPIMSGKGLAVSDYNSDGVMDVVMHSESGHVLLFNNSTSQGGQSNNWVKLKLDGLAPNKRGIGAKVRLTTSDGKTQMREVLAGASHGSTDSFVVNFGIGTQTQIDSLSVEWPRSSNQPGACKTDYTSQVAINQVPDPALGTNIVDQADAVCTFSFFGKATNSVTGADVDGVQIQLNCNNEVQSTQTDVDGEYTITDILAGVCVYQAVKPGFDIGPINFGLIGFGPLYGNNQERNFSVTPSS